MQWRAALRCANGTAIGPRAIWPHATAGFFNVKQQIPQLLDHLVTA